MKVNALYVGNGKIDTKFVDLFIEQCKALALKNVQIATDMLGLSAIFAKKRFGHNVLIVDHDVIHKDKGEAKKAMEKFVSKIPGMPVFVLCNNGLDVERASTEFGRFAGKMFFCEKEPNVDEIIGKIQQCC